MPNQPAGGLRWLDRTDAAAFSAGRDVNLVLVPARITLRPKATHAWGYRQDTLHDSWPMFAAALGAEQ
ncbi:hypothetical protein [Nocardia mikamii]|uniref:hypothetical protein n=1 Tax=Nocardia mikamii TaxID=508464 RepID=UPI0007A53D06|nr:hypothetical protein [Nocardia mikamii]